MALTAEQIRAQINVASAQIALDTAIQNAKATDTAVQGAQMALANAQTALTAAAINPADQLAYLNSQLAAAQNPSP